MSGRDTFGRPSKGKVYAQPSLAVTSAGSSTNDQTERATHVDPIRFAEAHAREIFAIESALQVASQEGNSLAAQSLPRHLRRRAGSHHPNRLPVRVRLKAAREGEDTKQPTRKWRAPTDKKVEYARRANREEELWLPTHLWHAKRCHMESLWGHRIATRTNQKAFRSSYRAAEHECTIQDQSFMTLFKIKAKEEAILRTKLATVLDQHRPFAQATFFWQEGRRLKQFLYQPGQFPACPVAPVELYRHLEAPATLFLWCHPAVQEDVASLLHTLFGEKSITMCSHHLGRIRLRGARSLAVLQHCFTTDDALWHRLRDVPGAVTTLPPDATLSLLVQRMKETTDKKKEAMPPRPTSGMEHMLAVAQLGLHWPADANRLSSHVWALTASGRQPLPLHKKPPGTEEAETPVLVTRVTDGWDVILARDQVYPLWKKLALAGGRVVGLDAQRTWAFHHHRGLLWSDGAACASKAYSTYADRVGDALQTKHNATPPAKRVHYARHGVSSPFHIDWAALSPKPVTLLRHPAHAAYLTAEHETFAFLAPVYLETERGVPQDRAMIYLDEDAKADKPMEQDVSEMDDALLAVLRDEKVTPKRQKVLSEPKLIGYVTTGHYSLSDGAGTGIGLVLHHIFSSPHISSVAVKWRNVQDSDYKCGRVHRIKEDHWLEDD